MTMSPRLKRGERARVTGEFLTEAARRLSFDGTVWIDDDRWVRLKGRLQPVDPSDRPKSASVEAVYGTFRGVTRDDRSVELDGALLVGIDWSLLTSAGEDFELRHPVVRIVQRDRHASDSPAVRVNWDLSPSFTVSACTPAPRRVDGEIIHALGPEKWKAIASKVSPLNWTEFGGQLTIASAERDLDSLTDLSRDLAQGYSTRLSYLCPIATFKRDLAEGDSAEAVSAAHQWLDDLLTCISLIEGRWVTWRERTTTVRSRGGATTTWDHHSVRIQGERRSEPFPLPFQTPDFPRDTLARMLTAYRDHREAFDAAAEGWILGLESNVMPTKLAHFFVAVEALKGVFGESHSAREPLVNEKHAATIRKALRAALNEVAKELRLSRDVAAQLREKLGAINHRPLDLLLQELVAGWDVEVDDLWPKPAKARTQRFSFVKLRNALLHGRPMPGTIREHYEEVEKIRLFLPRVFEKAFAAPDLARFMDTIRRLGR
jgi:hypothetical protein